MKKTLIVVNWKSNKIVSEATQWLNEVESSKYQIVGHLEVVLCPPFTLLAGLKLKIENLKLKIVLGAQDVSPFPDGAYTGEISARMLKDLGLEYVIIGHSERRKYFQEDDQLLANKVKEALDVGLTPIFCVQEKMTPVPEGVKIILYEPVGAIETGQADNPESADLVGKFIKQRLDGEVVVLYGGSVTSENVASFCRLENLDGVAIGGASLDANKFIEILKNVAQI
ncbi:MAG: triose-phosphate isomerase [Patescibacteria group bacterium]|nr:triose-phosphate isomerase [Patescibacteria group bacterium]MCL5095904.1 triose-phosphate isomerase [Patescibacteria group bacterium]